MNSYNFEDINFEIPAEHFGCCCLIFFLNKNNVQLFNCNPFIFFTRILAKNNIPFVECIRILNPMSLYKGRVLNT